MPALVAWSGKAYLKGGGTFANFIMFFLPLRLCSSFWGLLSCPPALDLVE